MSKATILALLVTAAGGCATANEPWTPPIASDKTHGPTVLLGGRDIPSDLVDASLQYRTGRPIAELEHASGFSKQDVELARSIDGLINQHPDGILDAAELVEAEQELGLDSPVSPQQLDQLANLWRFLASIHL